MVKAISVRSEDIAKPPKEVFLDLIQLMLVENENFLTDGDPGRRNNLHALFRYPAMMVPSVQSKLIEFALKANPKIKTLWDPFVGGGTTMVSGMTNGLLCFGQDINPLAVLLSKVKTSAHLITEIEQKTETVLSKIMSKKEASSKVQFLNIDKWFTKEVQLDLNIIKSTIEEQDDLRFRRFLWVVLAETIRLCSNDRTTTFKLHQRQDEEIRKRAIFTKKVFSCQLKLSLNDVLLFKETPIGKTGKALGEAKIQIADSRVVDSIQDWPSKFDLIVTSPPYGDNITTVTYGQFSYLQLQWINLNDIQEDIDPQILKTTHEIDQRALGGRNDFQNQLLNHNEIIKKSPTLQKLLTSIELMYGQDNRYRKLLRFAQDFYLSISNITGKTNKDGFHIWTIGNRRIGAFEIPNDLILQEFMETQGFHIVYSAKRVIKNKRMPSRNDNGKTMKYEHILIFHYA